MQLSNMLLLVVSVGGVAFTLGLPLWHRWEGLRRHGGKALAPCGPDDCDDFHPNGRRTA
jgi:hypothetical protein